MARHDQEGRDKTFVCASCKDDLCGLCIDVLRATYTYFPLCMCGRTDHRTDLERSAGRERTSRMTNPDQPSVTCPVCMKTSYHPEDVNTGYCGYCHAFTGKGTNYAVGRVQGNDGQEGCL